MKHLNSTFIFQIETSCEVKNSFSRVKVDKK